MTRHARAHGEGQARAGIAAGNDTGDPGPGCSGLSSDGLESPNPVCQEISRDAELLGKMGSAHRVETHVLVVKDYGEQ